MKYRTPRALEQAVKAAAKRSTRPHARGRSHTTGLRSETTWCSMWSRMT